MSVLEPREPEDLHHLAAAYALDALDADERRHFEAHYPSCSICAQEVLEFRETAGLLAAGVAAEPPPDLRARVLAEVHRTPQLPPSLPERGDDLGERRRRRARLGAAMASAAALVVAVAGAFVVGRSSTDEVADLLARPDAEVVELDGPDGTLRIVWSPDRDEVAVIGDDLADPGDGRTYALWFLLDDGVAPAALFEPGDDGSVRDVLEVDDLDGVGFGVTVEPDGGSPQPTTPVLFAGEL